MSLTIIHLNFPANTPAPPARPVIADVPLARSNASRARALIRGFAVFASLPAAEQRALWRHNATIIRDARRPPVLPLRDDGDAA